VFLYGALADRDVLFLVTRIPVDPEDAWIESHEKLRGAFHEPTICRRPGRRVGGLLVRGASDLLMQRLDGYYGPNYHRKGLSVCSRTGTIRAQVYALASKRRVQEGAIDILRPS